MSPANVLYASRHNPHSLGLVCTLSASPVELKGPSAGTKGNGKQKLEEGIGRRPQADEIIGGWWKYLPLAAVAFGLGGFLAFALLLPGLYGLAFGYVVMYIAGFAMLAILTYKQVRRLSEHASREASIRMGLLERAQSLLGPTADADEEIESMKRIDGEASDKERLPRQMYTAMIALPLIGLAVGFYYLYHLNRLPWPHESRWLGYLRQYSSACSRKGITAPSLPSPMTTKRSFALYAFASLVFFPILAYWHQLLIRELNEHFKAQWKVEDELLASY